MKFGNVPEHLLAKIDFNLPPEPLFNNSVLKGRRIKNPKVYVGAATWGSAAWVGSLYPPKTPAKVFRQLYPDYFNAIELNATHYNIYPPQTLSQWASWAKEKDFKLCPKFPQIISHHSHFENIEVQTAAFIESIEALGIHLGPLFLQTSETLPLTDRHALFKYLATLPQQHQYFLEVRHPQWFESATAVESWMIVLQQLNIGAVITDTPGRRDLVHMHLPVEKLLLRFVCNALHPTTFSRTDAWVDRLQLWLDKGLKEAYIFLHPGADEAVPELATYWINRLNQQCGLSLALPLPQQPSLF